MKIIFPILLALQLNTAETAKAKHKVKEQSYTKQEIESKIKKEYSLETLNINFAILPKNSPIGFLGMYAPWCDSLKIDYYNLLHITKINSLNSDSLLEKIINHELIHYRVDKLQEKLKIISITENQYSRDLMDNYFHFLSAIEREQSIIPSLFQDFVTSKREDLTNIMLDKMVNEGIVAYYDTPDVEPKETNWPTTINKIITYKQYDDYVYLTGKSLMYPILSTYKDKGLEYVLKNMPTSNDFSNLQGYQKKVLEELSKY